MFPLDIAEKDRGETIDEGLKTVSTTHTLPQHIAKQSGRSRLGLQLQQWAASVEGLAGFEARGIRRVEPDERHAASLANDLQIFLLWLSANLSLNNLGAGLLGPLVFGLGFNDAVICAVLGSFLGSLSTAYMCTWGPQSGNRTMVSATTLMSGCRGMNELLLSPLKWRSGCSHVFCTQN